ncbi:hypothetical protein J4E80_008882 [Alternaria sp. BMP 0032]|nr:hypothetical protein J4E80_008882 [Alternaria sp. BMP 0032]
MQVRWYAINGVSHTTFSRETDSCKFEHPGSARDAARGRGGFGGGSNNNRFGAFNGDRYRPGDNSGSTSSPFSLDKDAIQVDLTKERPIYPLSCYGPGKDAPRQLIEGPVEISLEELRSRYYTLRAAGNEPTAQQEEGALSEKMQQQVKAILDDITGAINYVAEGANVHPNRIDIAKGTAASGSASNPTGSSNTAANPFMKAPANPFQTAAASSQPSAFGQASTPGFGKPAFGQPAQTSSTSAFGAASALGNPGFGKPAFGQPAQTSSTSAFGAASGLGQKPSPFGSSSALGSGSAFGKPAFGASGFGQPSMPGAGSAFGQASSMGQGSGSAFGQPSAPGAASGFGQANALGQKPSPFSKPGFGQSGFGQASSGASPFGQQTSSGPSPFGHKAQQSSQSSPFGQAAQQPAQSAPFGQAAQQPAQSAPFGQAQQVQKPNPFGQPQQPSTQAPVPAPAQSNPFGGAAASQAPAFGQASKPSPFETQQPQNNATQPAAANPFLKPQASAAPAASTPSPSPFTTQTQSQPGNPPAPVQATSQQAPIAQPSSAPRPHVEGVTPDGKPIDPKDRYKEGKPEEYEGEQGRILEEIYKRVAQLGRFNDDEDIPVTPPKCEWIAPLTLL